MNQNLRGKAFFQKKIQIKIKNMLQNSNSERKIKAPGR